MKVESLVLSNFQSYFSLLLASNVSATACAREQPDRENPVSGKRGRNCFVACATSCKNFTHKKFMNVLI
jgi:hypothetical protein